MSQAALDADAFAEMKELMGDSFNEIIILYLQSLPVHLQDIETAIKNRNAEALFNVSHKMKSSCGNIGAFGLAEKAEAIELIGRNGSAEISTETLNELREATNQVISILDAELKD